MKKTKPILQLRSIEKEAAACRKAWKRYDKIGAIALHCHHKILIEPLIEPAENRINFILRSKTQDEQALRLRLFRPLKKKFYGARLTSARAEWNKARAEWNKARAEWNKARAELNKASAEWNKARAELNKASAELNKARAEWNKASAEWNKARAEWKNHTEACILGCPWDGHTIFPR